MTSGGGAATRAGEPELRILDDPAAVSAAAAEAIAAALQSAIDARGVAHWATTGGSAPVGIYRHLAAGPLRDAVDWDHVHVWWGDDRFVPRDHPDSNVLPLDQVLLSATGHAGLSGSGADATLVKAGFDPGVMIPAAQIHAPRMADAIGRSEGPEWVAERYEEDLRAAGPEVGDNGFPRFDVLFLGIGPDGHLLSVFPNSPLLHADGWVAGVPAPTHVGPHVPRVSLNPGVIAAARLPMPVVHGDGKAEILASVFGDSWDPERWPAQLARREGAVWFLDRAAASRLPGAALRPGQSPS